MYNDMRLSEEKGVDLRWGETVKNVECDAANGKLRRWVAATLFSRVRKAREIFLLALVSKGEQARQTKEREGTQKNNSYVKRIESTEYHSADVLSHM